VQGGAEAVLSEIRPFQAGIGILFIKHPGIITACYKNSAEVDAQSTLSETTCDISPSIPWAHPC